MWRRVESGESIDCRLHRAVDGRWSIESILTLGKSERRVSEINEVWRLQSYRKPWECAELRSLMTLGVFRNNFGYVASRNVERIRERGGLGRLKEHEITT